MNEKLKQALENMSSRSFKIKAKAIRTIHEDGKNAMLELIAILKQSDAYRQEIAIAILWEIFREHGYTHPDLIPALVYAIQANVDNNPLVVMDGTGFLADLKDKTAFEPLVEFLQSDNEDLREGAVDALGVLKDSRAVPYLVPMLNDEIGLIRWRVLWALRYIGTPEALTAIKEWEQNHETQNP